MISKYIVKSVVKGHNDEFVSPGVDSSYHVRTNVSVRKGIICGILVDSKLKGGVTFFFSVHI